MNETNEKINLEVTTTTQICPAGEKHGKKCMAEGKIPVFSCEGACIRGEIARLAANMVAEEEAFSRACHGEVLTVHHSAIAKWVNGADKSILIDGCFLRCHGRLLENLIGKERLVVFDALSHYKKYTDLFYMDDVPEAERRQVARDVADWVLASLENG